MNITSRFKAGEHRRWPAGLATALAALLAAGVAGGALRAGDQEQESDRAAAAKQAKEQPSTDLAKSRKNTHSGEFVGSSKGKLTMTMDGKKRHSHSLAQGARITLNGQPAALADLRQGDKIRVTTQPDDVSIAVAVEATRGQTTPRRQGRRNQRTADAQSQENWLGVWIEATPDFVAGVRVVAVHPASPAARAGLQSGDYLLEVNGRRVREPERLSTMVGELDPEQDAKLTAWRNGRRTTLTVNFRGSDRGEASEQRAFRGEAVSQAWLGVTLAGNGEEEADKGARIQAVFPSGPAARAALREDDRILAINGKEISAAEELIEIIQGMEAGSEAELKVLRNDETIMLTARLGNRRDFLGQRFLDDRENRAFDGDQDERTQIPDHAMMLEQHRHFSLQHQRIEQQLQEMMDELKALRESVETLKQSRQ